ncbi:cytochrome p450 monooxygenase [Grosmannia clavigera kw1407]|uniref:Cytochrome p450 monooxygenase n=1 Tax=Grosmannia clavigera (strain kw1407 / UAMH 11150) TaxID=655863 RepID=F0X6L5_GROCL|nr:cytochrome p450 monooxygenase [Grosmannia clavigera kw1407]EFX06222.1 cytochrome p450 monooxygenase [Grosmannia clavigera kw1407]
MAIGGLISKMAHMQPPLGELDMRAAAVMAAAVGKPATLIFCAVAGIAVLLYRLVVVPALLSPLARIPAAHPLCHVTPLWILWVRYRGVETSTIHALHQRLGPIVRTAPKELSVNCFEGGIQTIYTGGFHKTDFYHNRFANYGVDPMFAMSGKAHAERKRMMSNVFSKSYILANVTALAVVRTVLFKRLLPLIDAAATAGEPLEVLSLLASYSMDTFTGYQFGLAGGTNFLQDTDERRWYLRAFSERQPWAFWRAELPRLTAWAQHLGLRLVPHWVAKDSADLETWQMALCDRAEARMATASTVSVQDVPVVFGHERAAFAKHDDPETPSSSRPRQLAQKSQPARPDVHRLEIASDMYDYNAAAHETSGNTLTYLFYELSRRPVLQDALRAELRSLGRGLVYPRLPGQDVDLPDPKALDQLPLLDAILQETLRLWSAVSGGQPRVTPTSSCSLAGYDNIPGGVRVQAQAYTLHRNPAVFPEPDSWQPQRWMGQTPEKLALMRRWFWAWSSGGAMCIGSNFATYSMKFGIASVYTNYCTVIVNSPDMTLSEGFTAGPRGGKLDLQFQQAV